MEVEQTLMEYERNLDGVAYKYDEYGDDGDNVAFAIYRTLRSFKNKLYDEKWNKTQYTKEMFDTQDPPGFYQKPNGDNLMGDAIKMVMERYGPEISENFVAKVEGEPFTYADLISALMSTTEDQIKRGLGIQTRRFESIRRKRKRKSTDFTFDRPEGTNVSLGSFLLGPEEILRSSPPV